MEKSASRARDVNVSRGGDGGEKTPSLVSLRRKKTEVSCERGENEQKHRRENLRGGECRDPAGGFRLNPVKNAPPKQNNIRSLEVPLDALVAERREG